MGGKGIIELNDENFETTAGQGVCLVDFSADWCGPCRALAPILEQVATAVSGKASVAKIDIDASQRTTARFQVTSVPTLVLLKAGKEVNRVVGLRDANSLLKMVEGAL